MLYNAYPILNIHVLYVCAFTFSYLMHFSVRKYFESLFYRNETDSDDLIPLDVTSCANHTLCTLDEFIKWVHWNISNPDTLGTEESVLISEVPWFQGLLCTQHGIWDSKKCPVYWGVLISGCPPDYKGSTLYLHHHCGGCLMTGCTSSHRHANGLVLDDWEKECGLKSKSNTDTTDTGPGAGKLCKSLLAVTICMLCLGWHWL